MIKYRTHIYAKDIKAVEVERETSSSVWIDGERKSKTSSLRRYFDTWDEAHSWLMDYAEQELKSARLRLERAQGYYGNVKGMKSP